MVNINICVCVFIIFIGIFYFFFDSNFVSLGSQFVADFEIKFMKNFRVYFLCWRTLEYFEFRRFLVFAIWCGAVLFCGLIEKALFLGLQIQAVGLSFRVQLSCPISCANTSSSL